MTSKQKREQACRHGRHAHISGQACQRDQHSRSRQVNQFVPSEKPIQLKQRQNDQGDEKRFGPGHKKKAQQRKGHQEYNGCHQCRRTGVGGLVEPFPGKEQNEPERNGIQQSGSVDRVQASEIQKRQK